jgi:hypothetical protein
MPEKKHVVDWAPSIRGSTVRRWGMKNPADAQEGEENNRRRFGEDATRCAAPNTRRALKPLLQRRLSQ